MLWFNFDGVIPGISIAVLFIAICLGGFFSSYENQVVPNVESLCRMAQGSEDQIEMFRQAGKSAFVLGYTGETGRVLINELAKDKLFSKVVLIGRRKVTLPPEFGPEFEQKVVEFEKLDDYADVFKGLDVGFCLMGTTAAKSGTARFVRVDHDYVLNAASLAKAGGTKHFQFMSSYGANQTSSGLYTRTKGISEHSRISHMYPGSYAQAKGQVEEALKVMLFQRLSIFRPAVLMVNRTESRPLEALARFVLIPIAKVFPTAITIPVRTVARAFINNAVALSDDPFEVFENKQVHIMSGISIGCESQGTRK